VAENVENLSLHNIYAEWFFPFKSMVFPKAKGLANTIVHKKCEELHNTKGIG
jgi:hypothetical protein